MGVIAGVFALAAVAVVGGVAFGLSGPWIGSAAVASIVTPSPADEDVLSDAGAVDPVAYTAAQLGAEAPRVYTPDVNAFRAYANKVYLASDEAKAWAPGILDKIHAVK